MDKGRLEAFSDGIFSIAMTLLIFNIKVPDLGRAATDAQLWASFSDVLPQIIIFMVTFAVMSVLWINHHFLFHYFALEVDRRLNLLNLSYLAFVAFVPFSASFIGLYWRHQPAGIVYGLNLVCITALSILMFNYIRYSSLRSAELTNRVYGQALFRMNLSLICYVGGLAMTFVYIPASVLLYLFPVIFNILPGSLDLAERLFKFKLG